MPDLEVVAVLTAKAGHEARLRTALEVFVGPTRAEPGCVSYDLFESQVAAGTFFTIEKWRSQADIDGHLVAPHMKEFYETAGDTLEGKAAIHPLTRLSS